MQLYLAINVGIFYIKIPIIYNPELAVQIPFILSIGIKITEVKVCNKSAKSGP